MNEGMGRIYKLFRDRRQSQGKSLRDVERDTMISNPYLCQLEGGKIDDPSFRTVMTLCKYYRISPEYLIKEYFKKAAGNGHAWIYWRDNEYQCCKKCGTVRRADDKNKPCRGIVKVSVR